MISEVDIRDWDGVEIEKAKEALDNMQDYAFMGNINPFGAFNTLLGFITHVETIKKKQTRHIPVLERKND